MNYEVLFQLAIALAGFFAAWSLHSLSADVRELKQQVGTLREAVAELKGKVVSQPNQVIK